MSQLVRCLHRRTLNVPVGSRHYAGAPVGSTVPRKQGRNLIFRALPASQLTAPVFQRSVAELDFPVFRPKNIKIQSIGQVMQLESVNDFFQAYGLPRNLLIEFRLLSRPCAVVREVTLRSLKTLDIASNKDSRDSRIVITGDPGCGKSFLLLQSVNYALHSGWIVLYIPRAISLLDSSTAYRYDIRTQTFHQPEVAREILRRFLSVNEKSLRHIHSQDPVRVEGLRAYDVGTPLTQIIEAGIKDSGVATEILNIVLEQVGRQTQYPVLLAVDDFQALYCTSQYRDPDFNRIKSHHLSTPRLLLEYAGGLKSFSRGAFLGAISSTNTMYRTPLVLREAVGLPPESSTNPYSQRSAAMAAYTEGLRPFAVPSQLSLDEAAALFEVWMRDLALHSEPNDELFMGKYTESSGNARSFVWKGLLATMES